MKSTTIDYVTLDGSSTLGPELLGGKAWGINRLAALGLPTPPAFALTTDVCRAFHAAGGRLPDRGYDALAAGVQWLEAKTGRVFGGAIPLIVSVRSGAQHSMPGMMDTVLNLGITPEHGPTFADEFGTGPMAEEVRTRFVEQFERVVGSAPPDDPMQQLVKAVGAVFRSWHSPRACAYRDHHGLSHDGGTAVTVQVMVFGNRDESSGTGVLFTRNPLNGEARSYGEWLGRAQGEDVVSGHVTPDGLEVLAEQLPRVHADLLQAARHLETVNRDVQDIEFTVDGGRLWILQTRAAKRSPEAAVRIAIALCDENVIDRDEALARFTPDDVATLLRPRLDLSAAARFDPIAHGEPASPGYGTGVVVTTADEAEAKTAEGVDVVLARPTTDPNDVHGMIAASAVVTEIGGSTSHAAVVSRELGKPCVVGCGHGAITTMRGRTVTVDGGTGRVYAGAIPVRSTSSDDPVVHVLMRWLGCHDLTDIPVALRTRRA
ncbi:pyruvate, phosphate dikinase [Mycolicibacterium sp. XJ1819]